MGLKEKQAIANLDFSTSEKRLKESTGNEVKIILDTDSFLNDMDAILYSNQRGAQFVSNGIADICYNDIGKDAFNEKKIHTVLLKNQAAGNRSITMKKGVLTVACAFASNDDYFSERDTKEAIENQL